MMTDVRYCFDSLEDFLVTHPNKDISKKAIDTLVENADLPYNDLMIVLKGLPGANTYEKLKKDNDKV